MLTSSFGNLCFEKDKRTKVTWLQANLYNFDNVFFCFVIDGFMSQNPAKLHKVLGIF